MSTQRQEVVIRLLGDFRFSVNGASLRFATKKAVALFAYLTVNAGKRIARERLLGLLWPDVGEDRARRNLSTTLWRVKKHLVAVPGLKLQADDSHIGLEFESVASDVTDFRRLIIEAEAADGEKRIAMLREAEALYQGDLLEGLLDDEWCEEERRTLRASYLNLLRKLVNTSKATSNHAAAIRYLERIINLDVLDEDAHRDLISEHYLTGNRTAALSQFERLSQLLQRELGVPPSKETFELSEHIRGQSNWTDSRGQRDGRAGLSASGQVSDFEDLPTIGRAEEFQRVFDALTKAACGKGHAVLISGDAGIGKSKFVGSVIKEARLRGFQVLIGRCPDLESAPPYQVFIQALWPRISRLSESSDRTSQIIHALVDTLSTVLPRKGMGKRDIASLDSAILNECMLSLFEEPANSQPTLLVLEDMHQVDRATEGLVASLLSRIAKHKLMILLTVRTQGRRAEEVIEGFAKNGADVVRLLPLGESENNALIKSALQVSTVPSRLLRFVWERSGGVPLFTLEMMSSLVSEGAVRWPHRGVAVFEEGRVNALSSNAYSRMHEVIQRRIKSLQAGDQRILLAAAILGLEVPYDLLEQFIGSPDDELLDGVERIVGARLLVESEKGLRFLHESLRLAALKLLPRVRLRRLHAKAAGLIEKLMPWRTSDLAWHYSEAGEVDKALDFYTRSGDKAKSVHANGDALRWYTNAVEIAEALDGTNPISLRRRAILHLKRQEVLDLMGDRTGQSRDVEAVLSIADILRDDGLRAHGIFLQAQVLCRLNANDKALGAAHRAESLFRAAGDKLGEARAFEAIGLAHVGLRNQIEARKAFSRALHLFRQVHDYSGEANALVNLGMVMSFSGNNLGGLRYLDRAEEILNELGDERSLGGALLQKGVLLRVLGRSGDSEVMLLRGIELLGKIGDSIGQARGLSQLAYTHMTLGRLREALHESLKAIRLARKAKDVRAEIMFLNNAAYSTLRCLGYFGKAERYISKVIRLVTDGRVENAAIYYDTMAAVLLEKGDYDGALRWAKRAKALYSNWKGHFGYVGAEITFRLGLMYLQLKRPRQAISLLERVTDTWRRRNDMSLLAHGISALGRAYLEQGDVGPALRCTREVERILRRVDGLEQVQKVYWDQYHVFQRTNSHAAARRALRRAFRVVVEQANTLKGGLRQNFLNDVVVNREILTEAARHHEVLSRLTREFGVLPPISDWFPNENQAGRIQERRKALLSLIGKQLATQKELARYLGVSIRTVRYDLVALREQGLIAQLANIRVRP